MPETKAVNTRQTPAAKKRRLYLMLNHLSALHRVVKAMWDTYEAEPELNDEVAIQNIVPMSLDEWATEIYAKVDELRGQVNIQPVHIEAWVHGHGDDQCYYVTFELIKDEDVKPHAEQWLKEKGSAILTDWRVISQDEYDKLEAAGEII